MQCTSNKPVAARGPLSGSPLEEYILSDEGTYECYRVRGLSEWEAPVDESFRRSGEGGKPLFRGISSGAAPADE